MRHTGAVRWARRTPRVAVGRRRAGALRSRRGLPTSICTSASARFSRASLVRHTGKSLRQGRRVPPVATILPDRREGKRSTREQGGAVRQRLIRFFADGTAAVMRQRRALLVPGIRPRRSTGCRACWLGHTQVPLACNTSAHESPCESAASRRGANLPRSHCEPVSSLTHRHRHGNAFAPGPACPRAQRSRPCSRCGIRASSSGERC